MDRRRRQPLRLGHDDRIDRAALQADLPTQAMALLPVEIDIIVGIVEEPLVLFAQIAADPRRNAVAQRHIDRPLQLQAVRRSDEHTSELQSLMRISYALFCLKRKTHNKHNTS